jgi:hypothetical protein
MRLSRIRFTLQTFMFAVALIAANFYCLAYFYHAGGQGIQGYSARWERVIVNQGLNVAVGLLPVFNVALCGSWVCVKRRVPSFRYGRAYAGRSSFWGITFFSVQFLVLFGLAGLLMPDEYQTALKLVGAVARYVSVTWQAVLDERMGRVLRVFVKAAFLGLLVSGPPLLLTWIGQALTTRALTTLPRYRFQAIVCLVSIGFASADLAIALTLHPFEEAQVVALEFRVVDKSTGCPICAAAVRVTDAFLNDSTANSRKALTDAHGYARLSDKFKVHGQQNAFTTLGVFSPWGRWLEISAPDYATIRVPLVSVLGSLGDPARPGGGTLALSHGRMLDETLCDLEGEYSVLNPFSSCSFRIEPDGRFTWRHIDCWIDNREFGHVKRRGREIEFKPIPNPDEQAHAAVTELYHMIEWKNHLYLVAADERSLAEFCRHTLFPDREVTSFLIYKRDVDLPYREQPQTPLPRLPLNVWVSFVLDELSLNNAEGSLRLVVDFVIGKILRELALTTDRRTST